MSQFSIRFWGVRGSLACPDQATSRYGGNTACVEVRCANRLLILDGGTGLRALGKALVASGEATNAHILFSHCHIDHILGVPFFAPCYRSTTHLRLWAGNLLPEFRIEQIFRRMIAKPFFPIGFSTLRARIEFHDFRAGQVLQPYPEVTLRTAPLNHPGRATGYRLEYKDCSVAYVTDTEHRPREPDRNVLWLVHGVDVMIYDCNYTDEEFSGHIGWGHSTWQEGVRIAQAAGVKKLVIFHHDPDHDDAVLDRIAVEAERLLPGTVVAVEGMILHIQ